MSEGFNFKNFTPQSFLPNENIAMNSSIKNISNSNPINFSANTTINNQNSSNFLNNQSFPNSTISSNNTDLTKTNTIFGGGNLTYNLNKTEISPSVKFNSLSTDIQERIVNLYSKLGKKQAPIRVSLNFPAINMTISNLKSINSNSLLKKFDSLIKFKENTKNYKKQPNDYNLKEEVDYLKNKLFNDISYYNENISNKDVFKNTINVIEGFVAEIEDLESKSPTLI